MKQTKLRKDLDKALKAYIYKFEQAHGVELEFAVSDDLMGVLCFGDNYFSINDVVFDVDNKLPVNLIFEWQNAGIDAHFAGNTNTINLQSYAKGLRYEHQEVNKEGVCAPYKNVN